MTKERFKPLGAGSFFGDYLCQRTVPADHFLRRLEELLRDVIVMAIAKGVDLGRFRWWRTLTT